MASTRIVFLAIGELLADLISTDFVEELSRAESFRLFAGGSPANVCGNLQWLGISSALISCVGQDSLGMFLLRELENNEIDTRYIIQTKKHPTSAVLVGKSKGTPDFIAFRGADSQLGKIDTTLLSEARIIHTSAFALSRNPAQHHILEALSAASAQQKTISVDWNFAPQLWESDGPMVFQQVCSMHPLLKISLDDIIRFTGKALSAEEARNYLHHLPANVICLTCGKEGVWYRELRQHTWSFKAAIAINEVKDTTGAGDAFWSGFIEAWLRDQPVDQCVTAGTGMAARKIQTTGPLFKLPKPNPSQQAQTSR